MNHQLELEKRFTKNIHRCSNLTAETVGTIPRNISLEVNLKPKKKRNPFENQVISYRSSDEKRPLETTKDNSYRIDLTEAKRTLKDLNVSGNQFQVIGRIMFDGFELLRKLDVSDNGIFEIQTDAFAGTQKLSYLSLAQNHLRHLGRDTFAKQVRNNYYAKHRKEKKQAETGFTFPIFAKQK